MNASPKQQIPNSDIWSRIGLDRNKCIAIVVLSLILIVTVIVQFGGGTSQPPAPVAKKTAFKGKTDSASRKKSVKSVLRKKMDEHREAANDFLNAKHDLKSTEKTKPAAKPKKTTNHGSDKKVWPEVNINDLKLENPFGPPAELERMKKEKAEKARQEKLAKEKREKEIAETERKGRIEQAIRNFQQQGVRLVYIKDDQRVAQIGSRIVKQGDVVDGIRINKIKENGSIIFEVVDSFIENEMKKNVGK